jgi:CRISPR/Cas system CSM-associated protein Csm3 (group 7 of RAMP superfamily)
MPVTIHEKITGKIILEGQLVSLSPVLIGKGEGEESDMDIMLLPNSRPYIPPSSFTGCLASLFRKKVDGLTADEKILAEALWGTDKEEEKTKSGKNVYQSHLLVDDLYPPDDASFTISLRDGVKIHPGSNTAVTGGKYDYRLLEPGTLFSLRMEITLRDEMESHIDFFRKMISFVHGAPYFRQFRLGAHTSTGFGKLGWMNGTFKSYYFNFKDKADDREGWFEYLRRCEKLTSSDFVSNTNNKFTLKAERYFNIIAGFRLKSALMIGSYAERMGEPDKVHLKSNHKAMLPGKSIKGAIRHRALKILNTLGINGAEDQLNTMMGFVKEENKEYHENTAQKSRLQIEETLLDEVTVDQIQPRIRIDRFTGGAAEGALFDSMPVWRKGDNLFFIDLYLQDYKDGEAGLLLQLLKDLWTGDLSIGGEKNIGRGVLEGAKAHIVWIDDKGTELSTAIETADGGKLKLDENAGKLEDFATALNNLSKIN